MNGVLPNVLLSRSKVTKSRNMIQLPLSCDVTLILREKQWAAMWLVFWVISNVTTGFYSLDLAPAFYKWGYAWPVHNRKLSTISSPSPPHNRKERSWPS